MLNRLLAAFFAAQFALSPLAWAEANSMTLTEAVQAALQTNSLIKQNDQLIIAANERALAAKLMWWPTFSMSADHVWKNGQVTDNFGSYSLRGESESLRATVSITLFDGGVIYNKSIAADLKAQDSRHNKVSTQNSLALQTSQFYLTMASVFMQIEFFEGLKDIYETIIGHVSDATAKQRLEIAQRNLDDEIERVKSQLITVQQDFKRVTGQVAPMNLNTLDQLLQQIQIPKDQDMAWQQAKEISPKLAVGENQIEEAQRDLNATVADNFSPRIEGFVSKEIQNDNFELDDFDQRYESDGFTFGVRGVIRFGLPSVPAVGAAKADVKASEYALASLVEETQTEVINTYTRLSQLADSYQSNQETLELSNKALKDLVDGISGDSPVNVDDVQSLISALQGAFFGTLQTLNQFVFQKMVLLNTIGNFAEVIANGNAPAPVLTENPAAFVLGGGTTSVKKSKKGPWTRIDRVLVRKELNLSRLQ